MQNILLAAQIILSLILIGAILLQAQGTGLGTTFGGGGETYHTRRGLEKILFYVTIVGIGLFITLSIANLII